MGGVALDLATKPGDAQIDGAVERLHLAMRGDFQQPVAVERTVRIFREHLEQVELARGQRLLLAAVWAVGGFAGAAVAYAIQMGVARGIFSNEAGLGSAPIAHAAARGKDPVPLGTIAMLGTFIDTIIVCTITGLVIIVTGVWTGEEQGAALSTAAFKAGFAGGEYIVTFGITLFALTTLLGWSYYGEKCVEYIFGIRSIMIFRLLWVIAIPVGATYELKNVVLVTDTLNALMALPNLVALLLLSPIIFKITRDYFAVPG